MTDLYGHGHVTIYPIITNTVLCTYPLRKQN